jgi:hypothetical protein
MQNRGVVRWGGWSTWGADDELGTLNLITPAKRAQAGALVKAGVTVSLSHDITKASLATKAAFQRGFGNIFAVGGPEYGQRFEFVEEQHQIGYHVSPMTHLDALCHVIASISCLSSLPCPCKTGLARP